MIRYKKLLVTTIAVALTSFFAPMAYAMTPTITIGSVNGDSVPVTVSGDTNASVIFYYYTADGSGLHLQYIGATNGSGVLTTTISTSAYNISSTGAVYVAVNGQNSTAVAWPSNGAVTNPISLGQTSLTLSPNQQSVVTVANTNGNTLAISTNSNPSIAYATVNGNQVTVTANSGTAYGSTVINVCLAQNSGNCASMLVTVQAGAGAVSQNISFNQNNITLSLDQTITVLISGSGGYTLSNNTNTNVARVVLSGSGAIVTAQNIGTTNITICQSNGQCGTFYVTVNSASNQISFDQSSVSLSVGQTQNVQVLGGGTYYISSNSNTNAASASMNGSAVLVYANNPGSTSVTVCQNGGGCAVLNVTVLGATPTTTTTNSSAGATFSQNNITLNPGQSQSVTVYGNGNYSIVNNSNTNVVSATISGSSLTVTASNAGSASIIVCQNGVLCGTFVVTVNALSNTTSGSGVSFDQNNLVLSAGTNKSVNLYGGGGYTLQGNTSPNIASAVVSGTTVIVSAINPGTDTLSICSNGTTNCSSLSVTVGSASVQSLTLNPSSLTLLPNQGQPVQVYGNGSYYVSSNSNPNVATGVISGNGLVVTAVAVGTTNITVCQNGAQCGTLPVSVVLTLPAAATPSMQITTGCTASTKFSTVTGQLCPTSAVPTTPAANVPAVPQPTSTYMFTSPLRLGMSGAEVRALQKKLTTLGYFNHPVTGYYGAVTVSAVKAFQRAHGLSPLGSVGPGTRALLNK